VIIGEKATTIKSLEKLQGRLFMIIVTNE